MSPEQERRATLPQAKPEGRGPWKGRVRSIGNVRSRRPNLSWVGVTRAECPASNRAPSEVMFPGDPQGRQLTKLVIVLDLACLDQVGE